MKEHHLSKKFALVSARLLAVSLISSTAFADALVPATSEDIDQFDHQIAAQKPPAAEKRPEKHQEAKHERKDNFGRTVSAEAHRLNAEGPGGKKRFGQWVNSQNPAAEQSKGSREEGASSGVSGANRERERDREDGRRRGKDKH